MSGWLVVMTYFPLSFPLSLYRIPCSYCKLRNSNRFSRYMKVYSRHHRHIAMTVFVSS